MKKYIPNFVTLLNLISGCIGIVLIFQGNLIGGSICIGIGALLDFLDGFLARLLGAYSSIGKQLDSLADCVTFGLLPAGIMYHLIKVYSACPYIPFLALFMVCTAAFRLAKFNVDEGEKNVFIGLPTPASAMWVATLPIMLSCTHTPTIIAEFLAFPLTIPIMTLVWSWLLVASIQFLTLKFRGYSYRHNKLRYIFILIVTLLVVTLQVVGVALSLLCHILLSILFQKKLDR